MTTTLINGGTGKSGRRLAARLEACGTSTRVVSRHTASRLDWDDDSTWPAASEGVDAAHLCYDPDISYSGAAERVRASGAESTVLRSAWFMQNFSEHFLCQTVLEGIVALPAGQIAESFLDVEDLADVAAEVEPLTALFTRVLDGHSTFLTDDVARVLGRPPREFADYAREAAATDMWASGDGVGTTR